MDKSVRISEANYQGVKDLAHDSDRGIREVLDAVLSDRLRIFNESAEKLANANPSVRMEEVNGTVYTCANCGSQLDPDEELVRCPSCDKELDWAGTRSMGAGAWALCGLALVFALGLGRGLASNNNM